MDDDDDDEDDDDDNIQKGHIKIYLKDPLAD